MCATEILKAESAVTKRELEEAANSWEGKVMIFDFVRKYSLIKVYKLS